MAAGATGSDGRAVVVVFGASRGIGAAICRGFAGRAAAVRAVVLAAKTTRATPTGLPGSVDDVADDVRRLSEGRVEALPVACNVRNPEAVARVVSATVERFGAVHHLVYNPGAISWAPVMQTPLRRLDLMLDVNLRGFYAAVHAAVPHMPAGASSIVVVAPPIYSRFIRGKAPYAVTKFGASVLALALSRELAEQGIRASALWPAAAIQSFVTDKRKVPAAMLRLPAIFADATLALTLDDKATTGRTLLDEDYLRERGQTSFDEYRCDPASEPPRMMPLRLPDLRVEDEEGQVFAQSTTSKL